MVASSQETPVSVALGDVKLLRTSLKAVAGAQIRSKAILDSMRDTALTWFKSHRPEVLSELPTLDLAAIDEMYQGMLEAAEKSPATQKVRAAAKSLQSALVKLQTEVVSSGSPIRSEDAHPSFAVIPDPMMRQVLARRWEECIKCLQADAPMAAVVMMGGLLESLFLARVNREPSKQAVFTAQSAPKDRKTSASLPLSDWTLAHYIAVAHELRWISQTVRDVSVILRDYRNYIHPQKELSHQLALTTSDSEMLWTVCKGIAIQLL